jgi:DNA-binding GntR family transcriptional regulator
MGSRRSSKDGQRGTSRAEIAYARLRTAIHGGRFRAGERVREEAIAKWLGISRTPVRDALKRLESDGLLSSAPRRGLVVADLDQQQVTELYVVRDLLEGLAARLAAQHASAAEIAAMRDLLERQSRTSADDLPALATLNRLFHDVIYRAARNRYLIAVLDSFEGSLALLPGTTYVAPGRATSALREHTQVVDSIERRDADRADRVARAHIQAAERIRLLMISGGEEFVAMAASRSRRQPRRSRKVEPHRRGTKREARTRTRQGLDKCE